MLDYKKYTTIICQGVKYELWGGCNRINSPYVHFDIYFAGKELSIAQRYHKPNRHRWEGKVQWHTPNLERIPAVVLEKIKKYFKSIE